MQKQPFQRNSDFEVSGLAKISHVKTLTHTHLHKQQRQTHHSERSLPGRTRRPGGGYCPPQSQPPVGDSHSEEGGEVPGQEY